MNYKPTLTMSEDSQNMITMQDMCEHIEKAKLLERKSTGELLTATEIFNYSPTGELYMIFEWYEIACMILGYRAKHN